MTRLLFIRRCTSNSIRICVYRGLKYGCDDTNRTHALKVTRYPISDHLIYWFIWYFSRIERKTKDMPFFIHEKNRAGWVCWVGWVRWRHETKRCVWKIPKFAIYYYYPNDRDNNSKWWSGIWTLSADWGSKWCEAWVWIVVNNCKWQSGPKPSFIK